MITALINVFMLTVAIAQIDVAPGGRLFSNQVAAFFVHSPPWPPARAVFYDLDGKELARHDGPQGSEVVGMSSAGDVLFQAIKAFFAQPIKGGQTAFAETEVYDGKSTEFVGDVVVRRIGHLLVASDIKRGMAIVGEIRGSTCFTYDVFRRELVAVSGGSPASLERIPLAGGATQKTTLRVREDGPDVLVAGRLGSVGLDAMGSAYYFAAVDNFPREQLDRAVRLSDDSKAKATYHLGLVRTTLQGESSIVGVAKVDSIQELVDPARNQLAVFDKGQRLACVVGGKLTIIVLVKPPGSKGPRELSRGAANGDRRLLAPK